MAFCCRLCYGRRVVSNGKELHKLMQDFARASKRPLLDHSLGSSLLLSLGNRLELQHVQPFVMHPRLGKSEQLPTKAASTAIMQIERHDELAQAAASA